LQLKDSNNNPIKNGSCYLDIFAPNKTRLFNKAPMLYLAYSDGLYFYDYNLPSATGLYMVSASCSYSGFIRHYYTLTGGGWNPFEETSCGGNAINISVNTGGSAQGTPISLNNLMDWAYVYQASSGGNPKAVNTTFTWNSSEARCKVNKSNTASLNFYYLGETYNPITLDFYAWNWNGSLWKYLGSMATAGKTSTTATTGIEDYFSASLDVLNKTANDGSVKIMVYASSGSGFSVWYDWLGLVASTNTTDMVDLKGSGEIHVSGQEGIFDACSMISNKDSYFPNEAMQITYFSGSAPTRLKMILINGSTAYDSGLVNGTGTFTLNLTAPSQRQGIILELLCGNSFAHKFITIEQGYWDIDWKPLLVLFFAVIMGIIFLIMRGMSR
jgi:archaellum component FlaF (FlaF/FlaG flagellin family)